MSKNQKFKILLLIFIIILPFAISYAPSTAMADVKLETALPNMPGAPAPSSGLPGYINYLFIFGLSLIAFLALAQMMIGGIQYILAAGNVANKVNAKDTIKQALIGLGLLLVSYLLLNTINPDLVNLRNPNLTPTKFKGEVICAPGDCSDECKTECEQGVWDNTTCGCKTKSNCDYSLVPSAMCKGTGIGPPMANTPCESTYKALPGLYKNSVCCEVCK